MRKLICAFLFALCLTNNCMAGQPVPHGGMGYGGHMPPLYYSGGSGGTLRIVPNHSGGFNYYDGKGYVGRSTKNIFGGQTYYGPSGYQGFSRPMYGGNGQYGTVFTPSR